MRRFEVRVALGDRPDGGELLVAEVIEQRGELRALAVVDVDLDVEVVYVRSGKGGRGRVVPLTRTACACLETYLRETRPALLSGQKSARLFVSPVNHPSEDCCLGEHALGNLVARYTEAAGIKKKVTPYLWRHTCATHLLKNNANVRHVQELLGHRSLATTERYLRLTIRGADVQRSETNGVGLTVGWAT